MIRDEVQDVSAVVVQERYSVTVVTAVKAVVAVVMMVMYKEARVDSIWVAVIVVTACDSVVVLV